MKLLRIGEQGKERAAVLDAKGRLRDLSALIIDVGGETLLPENLAGLVTTEISALPVIEGPRRVGPCVAGVGKIVCVGLNYRDHAAEAALPIPSEPILFLKPTSAIVGAEDDVEIPPGAEKTDWEVELGVVIGRPGRYLPLEHAMSHVAGYCVVNDLSERAYQMERGGQWDKGKACDTFAPLGPWLVTKDEVPDPQARDGKHKVAVTLGISNGAKPRYWPDSRKANKLCCNKKAEHAALRGTSGAPPGLGFPG